MMIIAADTFFFFLTPGDMVGRLCSLPLDDFSLSHLILTTVISAFFHLNVGHFLLNMAFLCVFGAFLEPRLTPGQYLSAALLGSVLSRLISLNLLVSQVDLLDPSLNLLWYPPAGASGAIAGLMGCLVIRFDVIGRPGCPSIRCHPLIFIPVSVSATVLVGLLSVRDIAGHTALAFDLPGMADFWGHMGGLLGGLVLALVFTLQDEGPGARRGDVGRRLDSGLIGGKAYRHHLDVAKPIPANLLE